MAKCEADGLSSLACLISLKGDRRRQQLFFQSEKLAPFELAWEPAISAYSYRTFTTLYRTSGLPPTATAALNSHHISHIIGLGRIYPRKMGTTILASRFQYSYSTTQSSIRFPLYLSSPRKASPKGCDCILEFRTNDESFV